MTEKQQEVYDAWMEFCERVQEAMRPLVEIVESFCERFRSFIFAMEEKGWFICLTCGEWSQNERCHLCYPEKGTVECLT